MKFPKIKFNRLSQTLINLAKEERMKLVVTTLLLVLLIGISFLFGYFSREITSVEFFQFPVAREAFNLLKDKGLKPLPDHSTIQYGMIHGMLQAYGDPFTVFVEPPQAELQANQLEGKFGGIGIRIEQDADGYYLIYPLPGSPAIEAGVVDGDRLISINSLAISKTTSIDAVQAEIRGPIGSKVKITVGRAPGYDPIVLSVIRAEVPVPSVTYNLASFDATVGIIQVNIISETTPTEIGNAIDQLRSHGALRYILDLRNNGGGLVSAAVDVVRLFVRESVILQEQFKDQAVISFSANGTGHYVDIPLVIVVNQNTASAAEIIAGALQAEGRAPLVGTKTYGKDSVQQVFELSDGSSLHVTAGRWWLPSNEQGIGQVGLTPDIVFSDEITNSAAVMEEALKILIQK